MTEGLIFEQVQIRKADGFTIRLDANVSPGEVVTLMGPSGSGKSTLLAAATGLLDPAFTLTGRIRLDGVELTSQAPHLRRIGLMFQDPMLFPHLSVGGNLAFGLSPEITSRSARQHAVDEALSDAGLEGYADRDPASLSGGQQARIALMRVLLSRPRALLLDEPFSKLDVALRTKIRQFVFDKAESHRLPTLLVTHDPEDAKSAGGRILTLD